MSKFLSIILFAIICFGAKPASDCERFLQFKEGFSTTTTNYDTKDKVNSSSKQTVTKVTSTPTGTTANIKVESFDKKGEPMDSKVQTDFAILCAGGAILMDMKMMIPSESTDKYKNMQVKVEGDNIEFPTSFTVGQELKDAKVRMTFTSEGSPMGITMDFTILNRKVEAKETITTPAGSYECYKISQDIQSVSTIMGIKMDINSKSIQWYNLEVGAVRSENFNKNGKPSGYSLLTAITK